MQTAGAFPPCFSTLPYKILQVMELPELVWASHAKLCQQRPVIPCPDSTDCHLLPYHYAQAKTQDVVGKGRVSNVDLHDIKSEGPGHPKEEPLHKFVTGAQPLLAFIPTYGALCFSGCAYMQKNKKLAFNINWKQRFHTTKLGWLVLCGAQISALAVRTDKGQLWSSEQIKAADS